MSNLPAVLKPDDVGTVEFSPMGMSDRIKLSVGIVQKMLVKPTKSGAICTVQDALKFIALCYARKLNPFEGDTFLVGYDGRNGPEFSLITAHQAFLKRAEASENFDGMLSGVIVMDAKENIVDRSGDFYLEDDTVIGGWAKVFLKNRTHPTERRLRLSTFKKQTQFWDSNPAGMIVKCAEADSLRSSFPTVLGGLHTEAEARSTADFRLTGTDDKPSLAPAMPESDEPKAPATEQPAKPAIEAQVVTANVELADLLDKEGFTFDHLIAWGIESGNIENADSIASISDLPEALCKRLLRAKAGLLRGLNQAKREGEAV